MGLPSASPHAVAVSVQAHGRREPAGQGLRSRTDAPLGLCHHPPAHAGTIGPVIRVARLLTGVAGRTTLKVKAAKGVKMTTSENKKAGVEARSDVARRRSPGRYEEGLARGLAGLAYAVMRKRDNRTAKETAEKDKSGPEPHKK
jgi:hypothetical protein